MKKTAFLPALGALAAIALLTTGCETEPVANNGVTITPSSAGIYKDQYVDLTASGGFDYTWSLADTSKGLLSQSTGPTVRYTSRFDPSTNGSTFVQTVTVSSSIGSETSSVLATAEAFIEHLPTPAEPTPDENLYVSPSSVTLAQWASQEFTASGGSGSYTWSIEQPTYGRLSTLYGEKTTYTSVYDPGTNNTVVQVLSLTDSEGRHTSVNIIQTE